jgi:Kef-type K+ transport system membrane component KefB
MTINIIITLCGILLLAYIFDLTTSKTKIPSVILLLSLGWAAQQVTSFLDLDVPNLNNLLPIFGTLGLILIVLEGTLEVELNRSQVPLIKKSVFAALFPMVGLSITLALIFQYYGNYSFRDSLINAIPLSIISSAIAIPSVKYLSRSAKEFVTYESSFSDIFGVIFFDFVALNATMTFGAFSQFIWQFLIMCAVSFIASLGLAFLLGKIEHHIKMVPIIILIIIIYAIAKTYHLPALIFILIFGLFLSNLRLLENIKWINFLNTKDSARDVEKFREIVTEGTFLVRSIFFMMFGYLISTSEIINPKTFPWAFGIVILIFILRYIQLKVSKIPMMPLLLIAPRGLITILLFLAIVPQQSIALVNDSLIIQVIILTAIFMMIGLIAVKTPAKKTDNNANLAQSQEVKEVS